jgi:hypothetical protein
VAATREAQVLADGLAGDRRAGLEQPGHHGRVLPRDVALDGVRAVHHRDAGDRDVVLDRHRPPGQRPVGGAADVRGHVPGAERVVGLAGRLLGRSAGACGAVRVELLDRVVGAEEGRDDGV